MAVIWEWYGIGGGNGVVGGWFCGRRRCRGGMPTVPCRHQTMINSAFKNTIFPNMHSVIILLNRV